MNIKFAISILIIGYCFYTLGAVMKVLHMAYGDVMLLAGASLKIFGAILLLYKLSTYPKIKDFLNW